MKAYPIRKHTLVPHTFPIPKGWEQVKYGLSQKGDMAWGIGSGKFGLLMGVGADVKSYFCLIRKRVTKSHPNTNLFK